MKKHHAHRRAGRLEAVARASAAACGRTAQSAARAMAEIAERCGAARSLPFAGGARHRARRALASAAAALLAATTFVHAQPTSVYTDLDTAGGVGPGCETLEQAKEGDGEWANVRCPGPGGVWAHIDYADARDTIRVGPDGKGTKFEGAFTSLGPKIEWRLTDGTPTAMIVRLKRSVDEYSSQALTVHKIEPNGNGCLVAEVSARMPDHNAIAQEVADIVAPRFDCATREPIGSEQVLEAIDAADER